jgi:acyl carrier protein
MSSAESLNDAELTLARQLVAALNLEHVDPAALAPDTALFGDSSPGLGLDSIDALEIALLVKRHYGIDLRSDDPQLHEAFRSVRSLATFVSRESRVAAQPA